MANWEITTAAAKLEFDTVNGTYNVCAKIDTNHFINFWRGVDDDGFVQVFTVNTSTWAVSTAAARLEFDTVVFRYASSILIDETHFISFYGGLNSTAPKGVAQIFTVNTSTWAVSTAAARLEFDTAINSYNSCFQIDSNHFINFWAGNGGDGFVQVFTVNTTTWAVTTAAARLEFDTVNGTYNLCFQIDSNHFINFWVGNGSNGFVQVFTVNTTTWEVTTAAARLNFETQTMVYQDCIQVDTNHYLNVWDASTELKVQVFTVNTTTWAVSTAAAVFTLDADDGATPHGKRLISKIDDNHFYIFYSGGTVLPDAYAQVLEVNTTTWAVSTVAARLDFDTQYEAGYATVAQIDTSHYINFWGGAGSDGMVQVLTVEVPAAAPSGFIPKLSFF